MTDNKLITHWEELRSCGFYPQETRLECVIEIKKTGNNPTVDGPPPAGYTGPTGYVGLVGSLASVERVYFCVNLVPVNFGGANFQFWMPLGWGTVVVHDENTQDPAPPPWYYSVYRDFDPLAGPRVTTNPGAAGNLSATQSRAWTYQVRAILEWLPWYNDPITLKAPPVDCDYIPTRGNIVEFQARADPIR